ncbi:MAG: DUF6036 family nucleotidyltransferase [Turicibacter sp.]|nr:DUF6036 family nucleotidyltransferase [Turicibacter sp.]
MSAKLITKENFDDYLKDLGKIYRKLSGKMPAEIVLIGGAAIIAQYGFRNATHDIDAIVRASSAMKDAVSHVSDLHDLPSNWLNSDFKNTVSYSDKLAAVSRHYRTFANVLDVRVVPAEYLIAMKLKSGRRYKYDLSDVAGVLAEHKRLGKPISRKMIHSALIELYGENVTIPKTSKEFLDALFSSADYDIFYREIQKIELESKEMLLKFDENYPKTLNNDNIDNVLDSLKGKKSAPQSKSKKRNGHDR